jgi:membrane dipeptidase
MKIIDGHCDVLWKLSEDMNLDFNQKNHLERSLQLTYQDMKLYKSYIQNFAIFHDPPRNENSSFDKIQRSINDFYDKIINQTDLHPIMTREKMLDVYEHNKRGALLSLESCDWLDTPEIQLNHLFDLGVRILSLTWNHSNWAADGVYGNTHEGVSKRGMDFFRQSQKMQMIIDVSHLSDNAFAQISSESTRPLVATHSNCRAICDHPRNLTDQQILWLIENNGVIGLNFVPMFIDKARANIYKFIKHIEHVLELGGSHHIAIGSDFDGIDRLISGIAHAGHFLQLHEELQKHYSDKIVQQILHENWFHFLVRELPSNQSNSDMNII